MMTKESSSTWNVDMHGRRVVTPGKSMDDWSSEHLGHNDLVKERKIRFKTNAPKISEHFVIEITSISIHYPSK